MVVVGSMLIALQVGATLDESYDKTLNRIRAVKSKNIYSRPVNPLRSAIRTHLRSRSAQQAEEKADKQSMLFNDEQVFERTMLLEKREQSTFDLTDDANKSLRQYGSRLLTPGDFIAVDL